MWGLLRGRKVGMVGVLQAATDTQVGEVAVVLAAAGMGEMGMKEVVLEEEGKEALLVMVEKGMGKGMVGKWVTEAR